jgi:tetratricopeptide (TPR) repeat protein
MARQTGDKRIVARLLYNLTGPVMHRNDYEEAEALLHESLDLSQQIGNKDGMAQSLNMLGWIALARAEYPESRQYFSDSLKLCREVGIKRGIGATLKGIAYVALHEAAPASRVPGVMNRRSQEGDVYPDEAAALLKESLRIFRDLDDKTNAIESLEGLAATAGAAGRSRLGACLMGAAAAWRDTVGYPVSDVNRHVWGLVAELAGNGLGIEEYAQQRDLGRAIAPAQAISIALEEIAPPHSLTSGDGR